MSGTQLPLFTVPSDWCPPLLSDLPSWDGAKRVAVDVETCDPHLKTLGPSVRRGGFIAGVSFAIEDGPTFYLPIRHEGGDNMEGDVMGYVREEAKKFKGIIVGANLNYDLDYFEEAGVVFPEIDRQRDVQLADPIINELHFKYSLDVIAERWEMPGKDETLLREALANYGLGKGDLWKLPARYVGAYAEQDARLPLALLRKQERVIDDEDLWDTYNLESAVQPVLLKMRRRGVRIDTDHLDWIEAWTVKEEAAALERVRIATGVRIAPEDTMKKPPTVRALATIGAKPKTTPTGEPKIDADFLDGLKHPVAEDINRARKVHKLRTTFVDSIRRHMVNGRIHGTFNQMPREKESGDDGGARFGRLSMTDPNLQQQPVRDRIARECGWRKIYVPDEPGQEWCSRDYSQQEPRILTHYAEACGLPGAKAMADRYRENPDADNHAMMTNLVYPNVRPGDATWKEKRDECKQNYLGLCYGMGGATLARRLGLPTEKYRLRNGDVIDIAGPEAAAIIDKFKRSAPFVHKLAELCKETVKHRGYIMTILGRKCHFPKDRNGKYDWLHKGISRLIQGSAGDQTKQALVEVDRAGYYIQLQIHDELAGSINDREEAHASAKIMCECVPLSVPSKVDVEVGPSWGEQKEITA